MRKPRSIRVSTTLVLITIGGGLLIRFGPLGLPRFVVKYGGSVLWALMIYWIASTLLPRWPVVAVALLAGSVATSVEFLKLYTRLGLIPSASRFQASFCWAESSPSGRSSPTGSQ
jgi:hypothetical protein